MCPVCCLCNSKICHYVTPSSLLQRIPYCYLREYLIICIFHLCMVQLKAMQYIYVYVCMCTKLFKGSLGVSGSQPSVYYCTPACVCHSLLWCYSAVRMNICCTNVVWLIGSDCIYVCTDICTYVRTYVCVFMFTVFDVRGSCYMCFVTDEDLPDRNVLHVNYCPATCSLKDQSLSLTVFVAVL